MHRQPDRRLVRRRPLDPVPFVRRDVDEVAGLHLHDLVIEAEPCCAIQHHDPFVPILNPEGDAWPWETIRSMRTLEASSSVVTISSGKCLGRSVKRFALVMECRRFVVQTEST